MSQLKCTWGLFFSTSFQYSIITDSRRCSTTDLKSHWRGQAYSCINCWNYLFRRSCCDCWNCWSTVYCLPPPSSHLVCDFIQSSWLQRWFCCSWCSSSMSKFNLGAFKFENVDLEFSHIWQDFWIERSSFRRRGIGGAFWGSGEKILSRLFPKLFQVHILKRLQSFGILNLRI